MNFINLILFNCKILLFLIEWGFKMSFYNLSKEERIEIVQKMKFEVISDLNNSENANIVGMLQR